MRASLKLENVLSTSATNPHICCDSSRRPCRQEESRLAPALPPDAHTASRRPSRRVPARRVVRRRSKRRRRQVQWRGRRLERPPALSCLAVAVNGISAGACTALVRVCVFVCRACACVRAYVHRYVWPRRATVTELCTARGRQRQGGAVGAAHRQASLPAGCHSVPPSERGGCTGGGGYCSPPSPPPKLVGPSCLRDGGVASHRRVDYARACTGAHYRV